MLESASSEKVPVVQLLVLPPHCPFTGELDTESELEQEGVTVWDPEETVTEALYVPADA